MSTFLIIQQKLEQFIKKYYTNSLIKGVILFFAIGLLYLLVTLLVEHFLWLDTTGRTLLFWAFIAVELGLFVRFIAFPLAKLFKLQQGITGVEASKIIGAHFPEVSDKLLNVIQLNQNRRESELLAASIDQKASQLEPVPFKNAINYATNAKYLKYAAIPLAIFIIGSLVGDKDLFSSSYTRVVNYDTAYEPPAPFSFFIENENLEAIELKNFTLRVATVGELVPENPSIVYNDQTYYLKAVGPGLFEYTFSQPTQDITFALTANTVRSRPYDLKVIKVPTLVAMQMVMDYPAYTGKRDEVISNTGNATVPEGTEIGWTLATKQTQNAVIKLKDTSLVFVKEGDQFKLQKRLYSDFDYAITTSNEALKDYENLAFKIDVVKDNYPNIQVQSKVDSTDAQITYYLGRISDDYGLSKLQLVYYPSGEEDKKKTEPLLFNKGVFDQFTYAFPADLPLEKGVAYEYYFEVFDNDAIHRYKSSKSGVYSFRMLTDDEQESKQLEEQQNSIEGLDESLEKLKEREALLKELSKLQKEKASLNYNDKKKIQNYIKRQKQQEQMMKNFSKQLEQNLEQFQQEKDDDPFKEQLQERLKETQEDLDKNEELLKELEELQEKIKKEELTEKLEKLAKNNKNQERNLEQLLELTKRYYVTKKTEKIADELQKLGEKQEKLADAPKEENTKEAQEELNEKFQDLKKQLEELRKENEALKEPMDIPQDKTGEKTVEEEQQKATDKLEQQQPQKAGENQKKAGEKMKEMGQQMGQQMSGSSMEAMEEDTDMLRQILDNLVVFSFEQEDLMQDFREIDYNSPGFSTKLKVQNTLKQHFSHIDDSLFSLASRQPMIGRKINEIITDVEFNIDKSLERLAENRVMMGITSQQYTVTGANDLAVMLSSALSNMQSMMMGAGKGSGGQGQGFQLPDIIKAQESLNQQMEDGAKGKKGKKGEKPGEGEGEGQGEGQGEGEGEGEGEGDGKGQSNGEGQGNNDGNGGESNGEGEDSNGDLYRIYQEQQMLRQQLQDKMSEEGLKGSGGDLLKKMEEVEQELLEKGFNERTLQKMTELKYEMLKLDEATFDQGEEQRRESQTNKTQFTNPLGPNSLEIKKYFNTTEILNRESLPMRSKYKKKVQEYFKGDND